MTPTVTEEEGYEISNTVCDVREMEIYLVEDLPTGRVSR